MLGARRHTGSGRTLFHGFGEKRPPGELPNAQELLAAEFGTTSFKLVDEKRIEDYLQAMLEEGKARIEPHFFNDESGQAMKVLFIVS